MNETQREMEELEKYKKLEEKCIKENACSLRMLMQKWEAFMEDINELYQYRQIGTPEDCKKTSELLQEMYKRKMSIETVEEYMKFEDECVQKGFTFKSLLEAREKQQAIPARLTTIFEGKDAEKLRKKGINNFETYKCPKCGNIVVDRSALASIYPDGLIKKNYCDKCGQHIDWSGKDELQI